MKITKFLLAALVAISYSVAKAPDAKVAADKKEHHDDKHDAKHDDKHDDKHDAKHDAKHDDKHDKKAH